MADDVLLNLAADIVSAHVGNNPVSVGDLPGLIRSVYGSLAGLGQQAETPPPKPEPAVSIRASVKPDTIACLECGAQFKMLKRHLATDHGLTPAEYRSRWKLGTDYPMVAPNYAAMRKALAVKIGLGRKPGQTRQSEAETKPAPEPSRRRKLSIAQAV
jgi:predicted transcriptional regulator